MKQTIVLALLTTIFYFQSALAYKACVVCDKTNVGNYSTYTDGSIICEKCQKKLPKCHSCGKPFIPPKGFRGSGYCPACQYHSQSCQVCGKPISYKYSRVKEANIDVCSDCAKLKKCAKCRMPAKNMSAVKGTWLCDRCRPKTETCPVCGDPLIKSGYYNFSSGKYYCEKCTNRRSPCAMCKEPAGDGYYTDEDNRILCKICHESSEATLKKIKEAANPIAAYLQNSLGIRPRHKIDYKILNYRNDDYLRGNDRYKYRPILNTGTVSMRISFFVNVGQKQIYYGVSRGLGATWATETCGNDQSIVEPFADWVAMNTLDHFGYQEYRKTLYGDSRHYDETLNKLLELEKGKGPQAVLDFVKSIKPSSARPNTIKRQF